jgi:hemoglobin
MFSRFAALKTLKTRNLHLRWITAKLAPEASVESKKVPSLYEWIGGSEALNRLTSRFYDKVLKDDLLRPLFEKMPPDHPRHVADFIGEVLGGPPAYTETRGGHAHMLSQHFGKNIAQSQRRRWLDLLLETADEVGIPDDPEFRSAFVAYLEWGTRLAVINSQLPEGTPADASAPMPKWNWGVPGGPYIADDAELRKAKASE